MLGLGNSITSSEIYDRFTPTQIANLKLWLQNGVGNTAARWDDSSGNSNHAEQSDSNFQATASDGGLEFDASDDYYDIDDIEISEREALIIFVVIELDNVGNDTILGIDATAEFIEIQTNKVIRIKIDGTTVQAAFSGATFTNDTKHILAIQREEGATGNVNIFKNGTLLTPTSQVANAGAITFKTIGSRGSDRFFDGHILELLVYDTAELTEGQIESVNNYLAGKFAIG